MTVSHRIVGYDTATDRQEFVLDIPADRMSAVRQIVRVNDDDPDAYESYELSEVQAKAIANSISRGRLPPSLAYFLECFAKRSASKRVAASTRKQIKLA